MATQEELDIIKEMNEAAAKQIEFRSKLLRLQGASVDKQEEEIRLLRLKEQQQTLGIEYVQSNLEELQNIYNLELQANAARIKNGEITFEQSQEETRLLQVILDLKKQQNSADQDKAKAAADAEKELQKQLETQLKINKATQNGKRFAEGVTSKLAELVGFSQNLDGTLTGAFLNAAKSAKSFTATLSNIGTNFAEKFGPAGFLQKLISTSIETSVMLDGLQASFVGTTGASREFAGSIEDVFRTNVQFGVGLAESSAAVRGLYTSFGAFSNLSKTSRDNISGTAALLEKLGVSAETTGDNFNFLVSQLGMSTTAAEETIRSFTETGAAIGIPPQQLNQAFQNLSPRLAAFGSKAPDIFMKAAKSAKSLGMTIDELGGTLFALSDSLDTFEESASAVAAINLSLGGSFVNAFDLTMAAAEGPAAQLDILRSGFDAAGKSLSSMPFFQQKMLASELGLELGVLKQVIDGNMDSQEAMAKANPLEDLATKATSAIDRLNNTLQSFSAGLEPIMGFLDFVVSNIGVLASLAFTINTVTKASTLLLGTQTALNAAKMAGLAADSGIIARLAAYIKLSGFRSMANLTAAGSTGILAAAQMKLNIIMMANPVGVAIAGAVALAGAIYGLIKNIDEVGEYFGNFFGDLGNMFTSFAGFAKGLARIILLPFDAVWGAVSGIAAGIVDLINLTGAGIELPGMFQTSLSGAILGGSSEMASPSGIPGLAKGGMSLTDGVAMVGEKGPELVDLPKGAQVINNQSTTSLMKTMEETRVNNTTNNTSASETAMLNVLLRIEKALATPATGAGAGQPINVSVQLDKKKVGEATVDYINKRYDVFTSN